MVLDSDDKCSYGVVLVAGWLEACVFDLMSDDLYDYNV
jgi:hypothetical protein